MYFIRVIFLYSIIISTTCFSYCQSKIKGKIIDITSGSPIDAVEIINRSNKVITKSLTDGSFEVIDSGTYAIRKDGYFEKTIQLKKNIYYIIQLKISPYALNEIIINSNQIPKKLKTTTTAINIISLEDIERSNNTDFAPIINRTSGIFMQNGALNTNRITIRGIGSRNLFGTSKIRAYFKDIPLTNGSGETTIEDFELASIARLEIIKGASSSIYGAGLGGIINIKPLNAYLNQSGIGSELSIGSFGLKKGVLNLNHGTNKNSFRAVYSNTHSNGYRENNTYNRQTFTLNSNHFFNEKNELTFLMSYVDLKAFIPSSINEETYLNSPKSAAFTWKESKGFEDSKRGIFGLSWNHQYNNNLKQITSVFTSFRNAYEPRPFNILKENTIAFGIRSRLLGQIKLFNKPLNYSFGGELFKDTYNYETFENLYEDSTSETGSVKGDKLSNFKEKRSYYNIFLETNYEISKKTLLSIGLNLNKTSYDLEDKFIVSIDNPDQSGRFKFKNTISPKFGISQELYKNINAFTSISHGFSPISLNEVLLPDGQINTNLKPETGWNYEVGIKGSMLNNRLQINTSIFRLDIKNLLVARRTAQDEFIGVNAGHTQHDGLELDLKYLFLKNDALSINSFLTYTLNNFVFKDFIDDGNDFSGNDLTGVPSNIFNTGIDINSKFGIYGNINFQYVSSMPITDANNLHSNSYNLTHFKAGFKTNLNKTLKFHIFLGVNNIFDETYASQILINASGFGGNAPRYYYPGNPINYYAGVNVNYTF